MALCCIQRILYVTLRPSAYGAHRAAQATALPAHAVARRKILPKVQRRPQEEMHARSGESGDSESSAWQPYTARNRRKQCAACPLPLSACPSPQQHARLALSACPSPPNGSTKHHQGIVELVSTLAPAQLAWPRTRRAAPAGAYL